VDRSHGPMDKNRIQGGADQGERASDPEALVVKDQWRPTGISVGHRSSGRVVKECVLIRGVVALCLKGRRGDTEREVSRGHSSREAKAERVKHRETVLVGNLCSDGVVLAGAQGEERLSGNDFVFERCRS
jgi:hypothetical protein